MSTDHGSLGEGLDATAPRTRLLQADLAETCHAKNVPCSLLKWYVDL